MVSEIFVCCCCASFLKNNTHITLVQSVGAVQHNIPMLTKDVQVGMQPNVLLIFITGQLTIGKNDFFSVV